MRNNYINLLNNNKPNPICFKCKSNLIFKDCELKLENSHNENRSVTEKIYFCSQCSSYYITQQQCKELSKIYAGFYLNIRQFETQQDKRKTFIRDILLSNKNCFLKDKKCPLCSTLLKKEYVKIRIFEKGGYIFNNVFHCTTCNKDLISPENLEKIYDKASSRFPSAKSFFLPSNIHIFSDLIGERILAPYKDYDYDEYNLPPQYGELYDVSDEDYKIIIKFYDFGSEDDEQFKLRSQSFLGKQGYSTSLTLAERRRILFVCSDIHGKSAVINQLKFNIRLRKKQLGGAIKYFHAINVWEEDIAYVENIKFTDYFDYNVNYSWERTPITDKTEYVKHSIYGIGEVIHSEERNFDNVIRI